MGKQIDIHQIMTEGVVFKKAKEEPTKEGKKIKFSDFLRGTHGSDSAKMKAEFKYKRAMRQQKNKTRK